jgi:hypothetical protein
MVLDPTQEQACREDVSNILDLLRAEVGDLQGADQEQIDELSARLGVERLPVAVDEYMRLIGEDYDVCQRMFPGMSGLSIQDVLRSEFDWIRSGGRIPYVVSDAVYWLGPADPPTVIDAYDPVVWTLREGADTPNAGGRFVTDLERRVQIGLKGLRDLRQKVEGFGFCDMDVEAVAAFASAKAAGLRRSMERLLSTELDDDLCQRMRAMTIDSINRDVILYRRLKA